jgi:Vinculin Binding Site
MSKSVNNVQELGMLANSLTRDYTALAGDCRGAVAASANPQVAYRSDTVFSANYESFKSNVVCMKVFAVSWVGVLYAQCFAMPSALLIHPNF